MNEKSIKHLITEQELETLKTFLDKSIRESNTWVGKGMSKKKLPTEKIEEIQSKIQQKWNKAMDAQIDKTGSTYRKYENDCPINKLIKTTRTIIKQEENPNKDIIKEIEMQINDCGYSCPCPAKP